MDGINAYRATRNETASNEALLVMLLETALNHEAEALEAARAGQWPETRARLARVRAIYTELLTALDHDLAPQVTAPLHRLYVWCLSECARATRDRDVTAVEGLLRVTSSLCDTWSQAVSEAT